MAFVPIALAAAGTVAKVADDIQAGTATQKMDAYKATVARNNARQAEANADYAINAGIAKAEKSSLKSRAVVGRIKAAQAANNIDVNSGSAADVQASQRETGELDTETIMNNADLTAYGYRTQATGFEAQAGLDEAEGKQAKTASKFAAVGDLLGGASSVGFKWQGAQNPGGGSSPVYPPDDI